MVIAAHNDTDFQALRVFLAFDDFAHGPRPARGLSLHRFGFEIPLIADKLAASGRYDALVCLGAVIRGDTPHFDYVCDAVTRGIGAAVQAHKIPIGFGVLTTNDVQQAMERAGAKDANKGYEALLTVVEIISVLRQLT